MDEVNDASFDSFPASDAPVWSSMRAGPPRARAVGGTNAAAAPDDVVSKNDAGGRG